MDSFIYMCVLAGQRMIMCSLNFAAVVAVISQFYFLILNCSSSFLSSLLSFFFCLTHPIYSLACSSSAFSILPPEAFEIMPLTFQLPHEYTHFATAFMAVETACVLSNMPNIWILKPVGLSRGRYEFQSHVQKNDEKIRDSFDVTCFLTAKYFSV